MKGISFFLCFKEGRPEHVGRTRAARPPEDKTKGEREEMNLWVRETG